MLRRFFVLCTLFAFCYCLENDTVTVNEGRAATKNKKKTALRLWGALILFIITKIGAIKIVSGVFFWMLFQKFLYVFGLLLTHFMKNKLIEAKPAPAPAPVPPPEVHTDYNTIGYSYGPPEKPPAANLESLGTVAPESNVYGAPYNNWPYSKRSLKTE